MSIFRPRCCRLRVSDKDGEIGVFTPDSEERFRFRLLIRYIRTSSPWLLPMKWMQSVFQYHLHRGYTSQCRIDAPTNGDAMDEGTVFSSCNGFGRPGPTDAVALDWSVNGVFPSGATSTGTAQFSDATLVNEPTIWWLRQPTPMAY